MSKLGGEQEWTKRFDDKFTVNGVGEMFFDIEEYRTPTYVSARKPNPKEIKAFIQNELTQERERAIEKLRLHLKGGCTNTIQMAIQILKEHHE